MTINIQMCISVPSRINKKLICCTYIASRSHSGWFEFLRGSIDPRGSEGAAHSKSPMKGGVFVQQHVTSRRREHKIQSDTVCNFLSKAQWENKPSTTGILFFFVSAPDPEPQVSRASSFFWNSATTNDSYVLRRISPDLSFSATMRLIYADLSKTLWNRNQPLMFPLPLTSLTFLSLWPLNQTDWGRMRTKMNKAMKDEDVKVE